MKKQILLLIGLVLFAFGCSSENITSESNNEAAKIDAMGAAFRRNPEYLQLELMKAAAEKGNLIVQGSSPIIIQKK